MIPCTLIVALEIMLEVETIGVHHLNVSDWKLQFKYIVGCQGVTQLGGLVPVL